MENDLSNEDVDGLLNDILEIHGYDFSDYSRASLVRRIHRLILLDKFSGFQELRNRLKSDPGYLKRFVEEVTVNVTEMFRDPDFYHTLRHKILPDISSKPFIRIWHAGCSTGEEVYSMAIMLHECNLLHKSLLYATDINPDVIDRAKKGIFPLRLMREYSENYIASGGTNEFSQYYTAKYDRVIFNEGLRDKMMFSTHNLVSDGSFNEFQLILCRNVLIYFDKQLQERVFKLFDASLEPLGFIGLGAKETLKYSGVHGKYRQRDKDKIWRKEK